MSELKVDKVSPRTGNYVALNTVGSKNIIINGDMSIAQRGTSTASITTSGFYTVDRFETIVGSQGTWTQSQSTDVPSGQGFATSLKMDCTTADGSPASSDSLRVRQIIEGQNLQYLKKGTANAESITASFWVKSNKTGTYIFEIFDADNARSISRAYTIDSASTWEKKTVTIPGDTSGTLGNDNGGSFECTWWLGAGTNFTSGTLQTSWSSQNNANRAVGQVNLADNTANEWFITGVQLEAGTTASDFEFLPVDVNLQRCQRYYFNEPNSDSYHILSLGACNSAALFIGVLYLPVSLRNSPSLVTSGNFIVSSGGSDFTASNLVLSDSTGSNLNVIQVRADISGATTGRGAFLRNNNDTSAIFQLSSEL